MVVDCHAIFVKASALILVTIFIQSVSQNQIKRWFLIIFRSYLVLLIFRGCFSGANNDFTFEINLTQV